MLGERNGHLPVGPGPASPGWGQRQRWGLEGADPSVSVYDVVLGIGRLLGLSRRVHGGVLTIHEELPASELTSTRAQRVSAQQSSLPAAAYFQSYTGAGTGRATSPISQGGVATVPRSTVQNFNRNAQGAAELHPATSYDPYPSPATLYPKVV